ncbi:MAG: hypothetical protein WBD46_10740 [Acidobacteriaceae bacterium]
MHRTHAIRAQLRGLGSVALTGFLVSMLATTQTFAQSATLSARAETQTRTPITVPQNMEMITEGAANQPASSNSTVAELDLPSAPAPVADATPGQQSQKLTSSSSSNDHKVKRPGQLAVAIIGCGLMGFGSYIYAENGSAAGRAVFGSIFFAPGAVMAAFGFHFAFKPKNQ